MTAQPCIEGSMEIFPKDKETDLGMSNFDRSIDDGFEDALRQGEWGRYVGWNFTGKVRFNSETQQFDCEVWVYGSPREIISSNNLREIMDLVSDKYGYE